VEGGGAGVEHADPELPGVHGVEHDLIQRGEVIGGFGLTAGIGRGRLRAKQCAKGLPADADIQAEDGRASQIGEVVIIVVADDRGEGKAAIGRHRARGVIEKEGIARGADNIDAVKCLGDGAGDRVLVHVVHTKPNSWQRVVVPRLVKGNRVAGTRMKATSFVRIIK
jgi:hypothetical protein